MTVGFLGGGHMARALIGALCRTGTPPFPLHVLEPVSERAERLRADFGVTLHSRMDALVAAIDTLVLAVKPQDLAAALSPVTTLIAARQPLVISIAAGVPTARLRELCGAVPLIRAMPNRPAMVGVGATGLYADAGVSAALRRRAEALLGAAGTVIWIEHEALMDVVTAVSGSGPAYFFALTEALARAGEAAGLPPAVARTLARATLEGAGALAAGSPESELAALRESVTSRGGTTAAALDAFRQGEFDTLVRTAVDAAIRRGRELGG